MKPTDPESVQPSQHATWAAAWHWGLALAALAALAGCGTPAVAPPLLYLSIAAGSTGPEGGAPALPAPADPWRLVAPLRLPAALDREAVMVATAPGQWVAWQGLRWAEPLRDAVPRVLLADLGELRGAPVWQGPAVPAGSGLRIEIEDWEASLPLQQVSLCARWTLTPEAGGAGQGQPPVQGLARITQPWPQATPAGLVQAQRAALRALAQRIAAEGAAAP